MGELAAGVLLHDNAPVHKFETDNNHLGPSFDCMVGDLTAQICTSSLSWVQVWADNLQYSQDLALSDYYLFRNL